MHKMAILSEIKYHSDVINYFKEIPLYIKPIERPVKSWKNIGRLAELSFYEQLSIIETDQAFKRYIMSYKVEIVEKKDPILQLKTSKLSIKNLFSDFLNELKVFKYQITVKLLLKKYKHNGEIKFRPVYFNSVTKTVPNHIFKLEKSFEEILYMIDGWINNGSGWIIELIEYQYTNISTYRSLSGSFYMNLPAELRSPRKGLINIKNKDKNCFLWCYVRNINLSNKHPERILKTDKKLLKNLIIMKLSFLYKKKILTRLK